MGACCSNRRPPLHVGIRYILQGGRTGLFGITISDQVVTGKRDLAAAWCAAVCATIRLATLLPRPRRMRERVRTRLQQNESLSESAAELWRKARRVTKCIVYMRATGCKRRGEHREGDGSRVRMQNASEARRAAAALLLLLLLLLSPSLLPPPLLPLPSPSASPPP